MLKQALSVFDFLKIKYPEHSQWWVVYIIPFIVATIVCIILTYLAYLHMQPIPDANKYNFLLSDRFSDTFTLLSILPGFFIASLSAIAAINRNAIDETINERNAPYLIKIEPNRSEPYEQPLTRRVFLTMLFAYLSAISLMLVVSLIIIRFSYSLVQLPILVYGIIIFVVFFIITQIFTLTFVGISYLGYKALASN